MLNSQSLLVQNLLSEMDLNDSQLEELFNPKDKVMNDEAFEVMSEFFKSADRLIICGDYDCDGVSATSIAYLLAKKLGKDVGYYIPNRLTEGYGVKSHTIQMASDKGYTDVLIIDNGVKSHVEVELAQSLGMRVGIIDHHLISDEIKADAFLHPDLLSVYGYSMCAAGLVYALSEYMGLDDEYMLSLAALATVGDVMPLWGKNREIVRRGVAAIERNQFLQFDLLVKRSRFTTYSAKLLAFQIVPKVNSVGRLADRANVNTAVAYFVGDNKASINSYALQMLALNDERKSLGKSYFKDAMKLVDGEAMNIVVSDGFHEGLLGIVANQMLVETQKPSLVLRRYDDVIKGSARSNSVSLSGVFNQLNPDYFIAFGGHDFAFGVSIKPECFEDFKNDVQKLVSISPVIEKTSHIINLNPNLVNAESLDNLRSFEPFGTDFELPLLKMVLPKGYRVSPINGHGYKFVFGEFPINEAVFFNTTYSLESMNQLESLVGSIDLGSKYRVSFFVEDIIKSVV